MVARDARLAALPFILVALALALIAVASSEGEASSSELAAKEVAAAASSKKVCAHSGVFFARQARTFDDHRYRGRSNKLSACRIWS